NATGIASIAAATVVSDKHALTVDYGGAGIFLASTSAAVTQVVNAQTTTTLTTTPNPSSLGQAVTLTATVVPVAPATGVPTGVVTFGRASSRDRAEMLEGPGIRTIGGSTLANC